MGEFGNGEIWKWGNLEMGESGNGGIWKWGNLEIQWPRLLSRG